MSFLLILIRFLLRVHGRADVISALSPFIAPRPLPSHPDRDRLRPATDRRPLHDRRHLRPAADRRPARSHRRNSVLQPIAVPSVAPGASVPLRIAVPTARPWPPAPLSHIGSPSHPRPPTPPSRCGSPSSLQSPASPSRDGSPPRPRPPAPPFRDRSPSRLRPPAPPSRCGLPSRPLIVVGVVPVIFGRDQGRTWGGAEKRKAWSLRRAPSFSSSAPVQ